MKKTIHIYTQYYSPVINATSNRAEKYLMALKNDYNISIITGIPNYPNGIKDKKYNYKLLVSEKGNFGENIIRTYEYATKNEGSIGRILNYFSFMISSFLYGIINKKPDIIIVISPPIFTAISVFLLCKIKKIKYILEVHDLWPDSAVAFGIISKKSIFYKLFKFFEKRIYKNSEYIIGLTKGVVEGIKLNLSEIEKNKVILNYFIADEIINVPKNPYNELSEKINNRKIALFAGNMNEAYDFEKTYKFIKENNQLFFVFIGDGSQKRYLEKNINSLNNIILLDRISKQEVDGFIYYSDQILVPLKDEEFYKGTFPVKGIEGIVNNKKIIFFGPKEGEFNIFLEKYIKGLENKNIFSFKYFNDNIFNLINKI